METEKDDLLNNFKDSEKSKSKLNIVKLIFISLFFILFIFGFGIMIILLIHQSQKINKLTNQINSLTIQFDKQAILFNQNITNLNRSMNDNLDNLLKNSNHKDEEIKKLKHISNNLNNEKLLIYNYINDIKNELIQNSKGIEQCSNNLHSLNNEKLLIYNDINDIKNELIQNSKGIEQCSNNLYSLNNEIKNNEMKIFDEKQSLNNLESNLALLVDFKIKIKADFYINQKQAHICSHNHYDYDRIDDSRIRLCGHENKIEGCVWIVHQNGKFFEFALTGSIYGMDNWKIEIKNDNSFCTNKEKGSIFILETGSLYKYYKIKNKETGQYLFINSNKKRDAYSYYIDLTTNEDMATDFHFEIYHE